MLSYNLELLLIPAWFWYVVLFCLGTIIGSFLNVYIYRFHTGKSLAGSSHCMSCGKHLRWYDLFPLFSYLLLKGRCRYCGCKITPRYFVVELLTGILFALAFTITADLFLLALFAIIFSIMVVIVIYDLYHFIIPDGLTISLVVLATVMLGYKFYAYDLELTNIFWTVATALGGSFFFLLLWVVSKGAWLGFGDVKLAFPLGLLVGPAYVFSLVVLAFWLGAGISLALLAFNKWGRGKAHLQLSKQNLTIKSAVPFAPFLVASCLIIILTKFNVLSLFSFA